MYDEGSDYSDIEDESDEEEEEVVDGFKEKNTTALEVSN